MKKRKRMKAFFSIDAGFAIVIAVLIFASFSLLFRSMLLSAESSAKEVSGTNAALRLSSYVIDDAGAAQGGLGAESFVQPGKLDSVPLQPALDAVVEAGTFRYASVSISGKSGLLAFAQAGVKEAENYCVRRLALMGDEIVLAEVCAS